MVAVINTFFASMTNFFNFQSFLFRYLYSTMFLCMPIYLSCSTALP